MASFAFVQLEYGFALGPADGRYLLRPAPDAEPERVIVLATLGAPQRRMLRGRKPASVKGAGPEPVPTARATLISPTRFESADAAEAWLASVRGDEEACADTVTDGVRALNIVLRSYRAAALDPYARDVGAEGALVVRVGHGVGEQVADGRYENAIELPRGKRLRPSRRHEHLQPQERLAAVLGARDTVLAGEELYLRAQSDVAAGRHREAALQARIALEVLRAELGGETAARFDEHREAVSRAANAAISGALDDEATADVIAAVETMQRELRRRALT